MGEFFRSTWEYEDGSRAVYVAEQVSHHPPQSAWVYRCPEHGITIQGDYRPKGKFLGNSAVVIMGGGSRIVFDTKPDQVFEITLPNMYARGIVMGSMYMELGDSATIHCDALDLCCDITFKTRGFFGKLNHLSGTIRRMSAKETLYTLSGDWTEEIKLHENKEARSFFKVSEHTVHPMIVRDISDQEEFESRKLWMRTTEALVAGDIDAATEEKTRVEEQQRALVQHRSGWKPRFFEEKDDAWYEFNNMDNIFAAAFEAAPTSHSKFWTV